MLNIRHFRGSFVNYGTNGRIDFLRLSSSDFFHRCIKLYQYFGSDEYWRMYDYLWQWLLADQTFYDPPTSVLGKSRGKGRKEKEKHSFIRAVGSCSAHEQRGSLGVRHQFIDGRGAEMRERAFSITDLATRCTSYSHIYRPQMVCAVYINIWSVVCGLYTTIHACIQQHCVTSISMRVAAGRVSRYLGWWYQSMARTCGWRHVAKVTPYTHTHTSLSESTGTVVRQRNTRKWSASTLPPDPVLQKERHTENVAETLRQRCQRGHDQITIEI